MWMVLGQTVAARIPPEAWFVLRVQKLQGSGSAPAVLEAAQKALSLEPDEAFRAALVYAAPLTIPLGDHLFVFCSFPVDFVFCFFFFFL